MGLIMKMKNIVIILAVATLGSAVLSVSAQSINLWRGNETGADWNDAYKWKLKHAPSGSEAVHFRQQNSVISVNRTIELGNGMHLYGQELLLEGNGNINLRSPIPHQRSIAIPASSSGYANLTLADNVSVNGQLALAAKAFGTSASKGSVTLKDRATITGEVNIGNDGCGSGQIILRDQSTYRITHLKLDTQAAKGGSSEIHILGGTARLEVGDDPFEAFLADPSRKIIIGDNGTLHIDSDMSVGLKTEYLKKLLEQGQIISASGCKLGTPVIRNNMAMIKAERAGSSIVVASLKPSKTKRTPTPPTSSPPTSVSPVSSPAPEVAEAATAPLMGYIVFFSPVLLFLLRPGRPETMEGRQGTARDASNSNPQEKGVKNGVSHVRNKAA